MPGLAGTVSVYSVPAVIAALLLANVPGSGTVSASAGTATFSTSQAGVIANGSVITVAGVQYTVSAFNGTTSCTLSGSPTFGAASFVIATVQYNVVNGVLTLPGVNSDQLALFGIAIMGHVPT